MTDKAAVAKNVGVTVEALEARIQNVLAENEEAWLAAGKTPEQIANMVVSVAGRQLKSEQLKLQRSGATVIEGMFVSCPRYKDWGAIAFRKMTDTLKALDSDDARSLLVAQGRINLIQDNVDGTYTVTFNPSFSRREVAEEVGTRVVSEVPDRSQQLDDTTWFQIIENNTTPVYPSGDDNPRFGRPRDLSQPERTSLFLGRKQGDSEVQLFTVKTDGELAKTMFPTFTPGRIAVRIGNNGIGYGRNGVSTFDEDADLAGIFASPPLAIGEGGASGLAVDLVGGTWPEGEFLPSFSLLGDHINKWADSSERWDKLCATVGEVFHIDPRENGGYDVEVGDLDIASTADIQKFYIPPDQEDRLTFGVGSQVLLVGSGWNTRDGESRLSVTGWWVADSVDAGLPVVEGDETEDGWDA